MRKSKSLLSFLWELLNTFQKPIDRRSITLSIININPNKRTRAWNISFGTSDTNWRVSSGCRWPTCRRWCCYELESPAKMMTTMKTKTATLTAFWPSFVKKPKQKEFLLFSTTTKKEAEDRKIYSLFRYIKHGKRSMFFSFTTTQPSWVEINVFHLTT